MFSRFFIDRPVLAIVISILIVLGGVISILRLPVAQFPEITPPTVMISARYPGADAETVSRSIAAPIEQELSGTKDLIYFQSSSSNDGSVNITATFEIGTDIDIAAVEVQNRVKRAEPRLPRETIRQGLTVAKASTDILLVAALRSSDSRYDQLYLSNYATINMLETIKRTPGVGDARVFGGGDYAMRIWMDPDRLAARGLTVSDVAAEIREQNGLFAAGRIGAPPNEGVELTVPVITRGRLEDEGDFNDIILRANTDGTTLRLRDVGRAELGAQSYDMFGRMNGKTSTLMLAFLQPGANALSASKALRKTLDELGEALPEGVTIEVPFDTTRFISVAIHEVVMTFLEAITLVVIVVFLFLGNWRASLIPLLAVPVAIVGAFLGMEALGFSINSLTLFGLVLAIGIVVDDAIVVVENVERILEEERHLSVRDATVKAMGQVTGPVIAIVLVLAAVFVPVAFLGGLTGVMYRQFAVTIAVSVAISGLVALTLSPALCRILLRPGHHEKAFFYRWFDALFSWITRGYTASVRLVIRFGVLALILLGVLFWQTWVLFQRVPGGFIPQEDQGFFISAVILPQGSSISRTGEAVAKVEAFLLEQPEVNAVVTLGGQDILAGFVPSSSAAVMFVSLKPWDERRAPGKDVQSLTFRTMGAFSGMPEALVLAFNPPPVRGLGFRAGFDFQLQNRGGRSLADLGDNTGKFIAAASQRPELTNVTGALKLSLPQIFVDLDRTRTKALGVPINEVFDTLQALLDALYVDDFVKLGRVYRVQLQAEPEFRLTPKDIGGMYVRGSSGEMVPLTGLLTTEFKAGPNVVTRFNGFPSVQITGQPAPGYSSGQAMAALREVAAKELPPGYGYDWSGSSFQEIKAGNQAPYVMAFGLLVVFLVLAAQYERWTLPMAILLAVPIGAFGAILAVHWRGFTKDIYFQIGLLTLIGLAAKNAILIVEFCSVLREQGKGIVESAVAAAKLRFRPIVMTSLAFILGVTPLVHSHGAGAAGRQSIGTGVMGGMIAATFLAIFFVPLFFVIIQWMTEHVRPGHAVDHGAGAPLLAETPGAAPDTLADGA
ncbi:multidrug efflux RND transporter permease subunit [Candidatus Poribacteria bacterium]|nr:multidrug efflux RND transporter permease subunit [Candidatus Poribacteria bacterium]